MRTAVEYVEKVVARLPADFVERDQIATELRGLIEERVSHGETIENVLTQLGDPAMLADSYLESVPLVSADTGRRLLAKIVDIAPLILVLPAAIWLAINTVGEGYFPVLVFLLFAGSSLAFLFLVVLAEARTGQTLGKRLFGIRVVRESGALISSGQAMVRWLPWLIQFIWIDAFFALFTEKKQRAFELLSKTRVVMATPRH